MDETNDSSMDQRTRLSTGLQRAKGRQHVMDRLISRLLVFSLVTAIGLHSPVAFAQTDEAVEPEPSKTMDSSDDPNLLNPAFNEPLPDDEPPVDSSEPPSTPEAASGATPPTTPPGGPPGATPAVVPRASATPRILAQPNRRAQGSKNSAPVDRSLSEPKTPSEKERFAQKIQSFDFQNAEISDVIRSISQLTGKNFILDPNVKGKISVIAPSEITVGEAYRAFLSALAINSYTVVPSGKFLKVVPARSAQRDSIETYTQKDAPASDQMVTRIVTLRYLSVADIQRFLRNLPSKDGDLIAYEPTNSLIISDYGSNIRRIMKIIEQLDKPGSEERMSVIPIQYARAKDLASLIEKIINKDSSGGRTSSPSRLGGFPTRQPASVGGSPGKPEQLSLVTPDDRTNSLIVVGNQEGIDKVKMLVEELDFNLDPAESGGVFVYRLKHSNAEAVEKTLTGLAQKAASATPPSAAPSATRPFTPPGTEGSGIFGGDVKIVADKNTNSLIINSSKQDYDTVRGLLAKIDIPRDQVYVEAIIMEVNTDRTRDWRISSYYLDPATKGVGRAGFSAPGSLAGILTPANDSGVVLGFGRGQTFEFSLGDRTFTVPSLLAFINFLQQHTDANILSTPQILAMDNEEAMIEVGDQVPIGVEIQTTQAGLTTSSPRFDKATIKLTITPHISPESNAIRMSVNQSVKQASRATVPAVALQNIATILSDRSLKTSIVVNNGDTVVLGGLIRDEETHTQTKIPFLGDIPVLGWLFKNDSVQKKKINLMVFLTPKIVRTSGDGQTLLGQKLDERLQWMGRNSGEDPHRVRLENLRKPAAVSAPLPEPQEQILPGGSTRKPASDTAPQTDKEQKPHQAPGRAKARDFPSMPDATAINSNYGPSRQPRHSHFRP